MAATINPWAFYTGRIPPAPRGIPQIEVSLTIDANGSSTCPPRTQCGKSKVTITASSGLTDTEIEEMIKQSQQNAEEDRKRKELAEAKTRPIPLFIQPKRLCGSSAKNYRR